MTKTREVNVYMQYQKSLSTQFRRCSRDVRMLEGPEYYTRWYIYNANYRVMRNRNNRKAYAQPLAKPWYATKGNRRHLTAYASLEEIMLACEEEEKKYWERNNRRLEADIKQQQAIKSQLFGERFQ